MKKFAVEALRSPTIQDYGKLFRLTTDLDLPHYAEVSGYLKDTFGSQGVSPRGPRDHPHDLSGQIFLDVILSTDRAGSKDWDCERRVAPGT
jgi:hypothetical protein